MPYQSKAQQGYMHVAAERGDVPKDVVEEFDESTTDYASLPEHKKKKSMKKSITEEATEVLKALSASALAFSSNSEAVKAHIQQQEQSMPDANFQMIGSGTPIRPFEGMPVPVRRVTAPISKGQKAPDVGTTCKSCGFTYKSTSEECPRCGPSGQVKEAGEYRSR